MIGQLSKEEINRKLLHIVAVALPGIIFYAPKTTYLSKLDASYIVIFLLFFSLVIEFARFKFSGFGQFFTRSFGLMLREEENRQLTGATYILAGAGICSFLSLISELATGVCFLCLTLFIIGDAAAAIVGKAIGRIKFRKKTLEGGIACFLTCFLITFFIFPELPYFVSSLGVELSIYQIVIISLTISFLEFFPLKYGAYVLNDNLYVPAITSLVAMLLV